MNHDKMFQPSNTRHQEGRAELPQNRKGETVGQWMREDFEVEHSHKIEMGLDDDDDDDKKKKNKKKKKKKRKKKKKKKKKRKRQKRRKRRRRKKKDDDDDITNRLIASHIQLQQLDKHLFV
jgi:hypothetical protein